MDQNKNTQMTTKNTYQAENVIFITEPAPISITLNRDLEPDTTIEIVIKKKDGTTDNINVTCPAISTKGTIIKCRVQKKIKPIVQECIDSMVSSSKNNIEKDVKKYGMAPDDFDDFNGAFDEYSEKDLTINDMLFISYWVSKILRKWVLEKKIKIVPESEFKYDFSGWVDDSDSDCEEPSYFAQRDALRNWPLDE